ncbi:MAG: hypothetical protein WBB45_19120 [Cyclobacteriaceae bacterium]
MTMISGKGIDAYILESILAFLNSAKTIEDITLLDEKYQHRGTLQDDYDIGETLAQRILDRRKELGGKLTDVSQLSNIQGFGEDKFDDLVTAFKRINATEQKEYTSLSEPLFRFASLRYHHSKPAIATLKREDSTANIEKSSGGSPSFKIQKSLSKDEVRDLEKDHVASLARQSIKFIGELSDKLEELYDAYLKEKREVITNAEERYEAILSENIQAYEESLSPEEREKLEELKQKAAANDQENNDQEYNYPESVYPELNLNFPEFSSKHYLAKRLENDEAQYLEKHKFYNQEYLTLQDKLQEDARKKHELASQAGLRFSKTVAIKGTPINLKNRFSNGYVLSLDQQKGAIYLSIVVPAVKQFPDQAEVFVRSGDESFRSVQIRLLDNMTRVLFLEASFDKLPDLSQVQSFSYEVKLTLNSSEQIHIEEKVSGLNDIWVGKWKPQPNSAVNELKNTGTTGSVFADKDNISGVVQMGWADLMRVEQTFCCYVPGEISHIENIMAREYKEKSTEYLERSESTYIEEKETETSEKNDTTTVEKNDWNKEVERTLERSFDLNVSTEVTYGSKDKGMWYAAVNADMALANSSSQTTDNAQSFSQEVTQSASQSIRTKITEKRTTTLIKEFKEMQKHGYDNRSGDEHVSGVFRWLDKVYKNKIIKYGRGMLYEFMIPKPAEFYVESLAEPDKDPVKMPEPPEPLDISSWRELTRDNYLHYVNKYGVNNYDEPKDAHKSHSFMSGEINYDKLKNNNTTVKNYSFQSIGLDDYVLTNINQGSSYGIWYLNPPIHDPNAKFIAQINQTGSGSRHTLVSISASQMQTAVFAGRKYRSNNISAGGLNYQGGFDLTIESRRVDSVQHLNIHAEFILKHSVYQSWQQATFQAIQDAYQILLDDYNQALADAQTQIDADTDADLYDANQYKHPGAYREIINTELKRLCIELLWQKVNPEINRCTDYYATTSCNKTGDCEEVSALNNLDKLDDYTSVVKFLEQSFHWSLSSHNLYSYFWASPCDWVDMLHNEDTPDTAFQKFLKSGMARVMVPVREGFEKAVAYFLVTGKPWFGEEPPQINDDLYVSVVTEMKKPLGTQVGDTWETNVPSTLTLLQAGSTYLDQQGLPCCKEFKGETGIGWSKNTKLEGQIDPANDDDDQNSDISA